MRVGNNQKIQASILDRLIDDAPDERDSKESRYGLSLRQLRANVRRDLQNLLNSKMRWHTWPEYYEELDKSLLNYGLPDFSTMAVSTLEGREALCAHVEETIRRFEPRFLEVQVTVPDKELPEDRIIKLRINALLYADPEPEPITFDSEIEPIHLGLKVLETF